MEPKEESKGHEGGVIVGGAPRGGYVARGHDARSHPVQPDVKVRDMDLLMGYQSVAHTSTSSLELLNRLVVNIQRLTYC